MPKNRPGRIKYVTATKATTHGAAVIEGNLSGVAVKTKPPAWSDPFATQSTIAIGEHFSIINKGIVEVPASALAGVAKGDAVYITTADNSLATAAASGKVPFGRVAELAGERGGSPSKVRVDLDAKDSI